MNNRLKQILYIIIALLSLNVNAQINRANTKKLNPYRSNYERMSSGSTANHSFEIKGGALWAWGNNQHGQLGDGTHSNRRLEVQIGSETHWISTDEGHRHTLGLKSDGSVWAWGQNNNGQLGDGTHRPRTKPVKVNSKYDNWVSIAAGENHSIGLKADGTLWTWGSNSYGQLGDGSLIDSNTPVQIGTDTKWVSIAAGSNHSLALKADGTLWAWGDNLFGQLGDGTHCKKIIPIQITQNDKWVSISAGGYHSLALKADGTLWTWGNNIHGQLGDGISLFRDTPGQIGNDNNWVGISGGGFHSLALKANGTLWAWGANASGQLGNGGIIDSRHPAQLGKENNWVSIAGGAHHSLGLKSDGTLWSWGNNIFGQVGDGTNLTRYKPVHISSESNSWISLATGFAYSLGVKSDGTLWAWGLNENGQLGDGTTTDRNIPIQIGTDHNWVCVVAIGYHESSYALKSNGTLWAWGSNIYGKLGDGSGVNQHSPVQIGTDNNWVSIAPGVDHCIGLKANGTIWGWGYNLFGQVGDATLTDRSVPVQTGTDNDWVSIGAGSDQSYALKSNGTRWGWGLNTGGQLGEGTTLNYYSPEQLFLDNDWVKVVGGEGGGYGLKSDGTLWRWGIIPSQQGTDHNWISIAVGEDHNLSIKADGTLWAAGNNSYGQLGDGTTSSHFNLIQIGTENNWICVSTWLMHTLALKSERNQICGTGDNAAGQLGDHTLISRTTFECYPSLMPAMTAKLAVDANETTVNQNQLMIFPNPSNGMFTVQSKIEVVFTIINSLGQPVQTIKLNGSNDYTARIDDLNNGIYFIVGNNKNKVINQKVVVDK